MAGATLEQSIKTYEIDTNIKLGDEFAAKNFPNDLAKFKEAVSKTSAKFHQQQGGSTWPTLARILKAFQTLGTLTSSAVSVTPFAPAALILGATLHLVHVTSQMIEAYSSIGDILAKIAGITDRLKIHSEAKVMRGELKSLIRRMLGVIVEVLGLASKLISKKRRKRDITKEYFQRLLFDEKSPLVTKMAALDGLATEENALVLALAGNGIQRIEGTMDQRHLETRLEKILQDELWTSMKQLHDKYTNSSKDGINADWIVDEPEVQQWMSVQAEKSKSALIWITAEQGTGKSYTASHLIRELLKDKSFITTYFYVQGHEKREHLALSILACIALQLINKSKPFKAIATKALSDTESGWTAETIWKKLFEPYMKRSHWMRIFIVIDGLDAADPREQDIILSKLKVLKDGKFAGGYQLHAAIFARPSLSSKYDIWTGSTFRIPEDKIRKGVADFIESKLSSLALFKKLSGAVQSQKIRQLKENIQTDFSLAALVIAQAQAYSRFNDLTMFLDRPISPDIEIHVRDILNQVSSDIYQKRHWLATLRWIACAYRNLTVNEVLFIRNADLDDDNLPLPKVVSSDDLKAENQSILTFPTHSSVSQTESSLVEIKNGIVRDYLAKDGKRMLRDLDVGYAIDNNAHAAIAEVCLRRLLRNEGKIPSATKPDIMAYAADYVIEHFRAVKKDDGILEPGKKRQLANQMRQLLGDPSAIQRWYNSVSKGKLLEIIRLLLNDDEVLERIKQWTPELTLSGQPLSGHDLYTPFAQLCNKAWIEGANMDTQFCLLFLHHYNCLDLPSDKRSDGMPIEIAELKAGRILGLADYTLDKESGLIRDSNWHVRVADALREAKHLETARIEYGYAEEDPTNWMARNGLALIFAAEGNTLKAIQKAREALACIPKPDDQCQSNIYFNLYNWQMVRGKTSDAIDAAQSAHELDPNNFAKTANYFSALGRAKRWKTLLKLCEKLHYSKATPSDLIELLLGWEEGHDILTRAVTAVKEHQPLAKEIFKTLVQTAKERDDLLGSVWEEYQRGLFFYHHARGDKEHLRIWERLPTEPEHEATHRYAQQLQCKALVDIYYRNALRSKSKQDTEKWVSKLETLAGVPSGKVKPKKDMEDRADAAMFLGRWRHKQDDISKAQLKALFRPRICQGIRILEDDDPLNDSDGYAILAKALLHAGYMDEACETFAAGMLPLATSSKWIKEKKDAGESQIQQAIKAMPIPFECHGKLGCSPDKWLAFYVCRECLDKSFCVTCLTGNSTRVCDKSHQMVQVYLKGRDTAKPIAKFQGSLLEVDKKWLKKLKEKWGITEETKATSSLPTPDIILRNQMNRSSVC